jgi:hypothetical protein
MSVTLDCTNALLVRCGKKLKKNILTVATVVARIANVVWWVLAHFALGESGVRR